MANDSRGSNGLRVSDGRKSFGFMGQLLSIIITAGFNKVAMGRIFYDVTFVCISATYSFGFLAAKKLLGFI